MIYRYKSTFTRPGNATIYTAGDAVTDAAGDPITIIPAGAIREGYIMGAKLSIGNGNVTNGTFRLFLFSDDDNLPTITDNSALVLDVDAEEDLIGYLDFTLDGAGSSGSTVALDSLADLYVPYVAKNLSTGRKGGIYGILAATGAYDPIGELTVVDVVLSIEPSEE